MKPKVETNSANETMTQSILKISLNSLNQDFNLCEVHTETHKWSSCYYLIARYISEHLESKFGRTWSVSVGDYSKCYLKTNKFNFITEFSIGQIGFEIQNIKI